MKKISILRDSILWHDGMMLTAKHFQQLTDRLEELIYYHSNLNMPFNWGVKTFKIDKDELTHGAFVVTELEAIMPDGLVVHDSHTNKNVLELNLLDEVEEGRDKSFKIFLYIPPKDRVLTESENLPRYKQFYPEVIEEDTYSYQDAHIPYQIPNINLIAATEVADDNSSIPLIQIEYKNGQFLVKDYIPPLLTVEPYSELGRVISGIIQKVKMKAKFIAQQISITSVQYEPAILDKRLLLQNLLTALPHLEALLKLGTAHPFDIYLALCSLIGSLAPLSFDYTLPSLPLYDHNNLRDTFAKVRDYIFQILDESIGETYHAIPFERDGNRFVLKLNKYWLKHALIIGIQPKEGKSDSDILKWMLNCLIGNEQDIPRMRRERTLGAQRIKIEKDANFPPTMDTMFFSIEQESLKPDMDLVIFNPSDKPGERAAEKIHLYIKRRSEV